MKVTDVINDLTRMSMRQIGEGKDEDILPFEHCNPLPLLSKDYTLRFMSKLYAKVYTHVSLKQLPVLLNPHF